MNSKSKIEQNFLENQPSSALLLNQYMNGSKKVSYDDIVLACRKERFAKLLNQACFTKEFLVPIMIIPVMIFVLVWD